VKKPRRQIGMVIDLNKCIGCQTCSIACKRLWTGGAGQERMWWNKVNTMPGEGSPRGWDGMGGGFDSGQSFMGLRLGPGKPRPSRLPEDEEFGTYVELPAGEEVARSGEGRRTTAPEARPPWMYNWDEDRGAGEHPNSFFFYLARLCNHCDKPACLEACPRDAIYKRDEDGIVLINEDKCEGYRFCLEACPYKVIYFNPQENVAQKCIGCYPRVEVGVAPACARHCPARARFYGYVDDPESTVYKLREWKVALPLQPKFGTGPNVFYIPVLSSSRLDDAGRPTGEPRIPLDYLKSLFGDDVEGALNTLREERQKMRNGGSSPLMDILIGWRWPDDFFAPFVKAPDEAKAPHKEVTGDAAER